MKKFFVIINVTMLYKSLYDHNCMKFSNSSLTIKYNTFDLEDYLKYGNPGTGNDLLSRAAYISSYSRQHKTPSWVMEKLTKDNLIESSDKPTRSDGVFMEDREIQDKFRSKLHDYLKSGYDRGHMAPASDGKRSMEAYKQTFFLSNMSPQVGKGFNQSYWRLLEDFCRHLTEKFEEVYVLTGTLYLPKKVDGKWIVQYEMIGNPPNVAVPTHFYKAILVESNGKPEAIEVFVLPNAQIGNTAPLTDFKSSFDFVERSAGLNIFDKLGDNKEKTVPHLCDKIPCTLKNKY